MFIYFVFEVELESLIVGISRVGIGPHVSELLGLVLVVQEFFIACIIQRIAR